MHLYALNINTNIPVQVHNTLNWTFYNIYHIKKYNIYTYCIYKITILQFILFYFSFNFKVNVFYLFPFTTIDKQNKKGYIFFTCQTQCAPQRFLFIFVLHSYKCASVSGKDFQETYTQPYGKFFSWIYSDNENTFLSFIYSHPFSLFPYKHSLDLPRCQQFTTIERRISQLKVRVYFSERYIYEHGASRWVCKFSRSFRPQLHVQLFVTEFYTHNIYMFIYTGRKYVSQHRVRMATKLYSHRLLNKIKFISHITIKKLE